MEWYRARVSDSRGRITELRREASSEDALLRDLSGEGLYPISITADKDGRSSRRRRFSPKTVLEFTEGLSELLQAGLSLRDALEIAATAFDRGKAGTLAAGLRDSIVKGQPLHKSLAEHGRSFSQLYRGLVQVGEHTGSLSRVIPHLATYLRGQRELKDRVSAALTYPVIVIIVSILALVVVSVVVIPSVSAMSEQLGAAAPEQLTMAVDRIGRWTNVLWVVLGVVAGVVVTFILARRSARAGRALDAGLLRVPLIGNYIRQTQIAQLVFAMEALTESGVSVEDAVERARDVVTNQAIAADLVLVREQLDAGVRFADALAATRTIPERVKGWARIGERTGSVSRVFGQMRSYYDREIERLATRLSSLVEPALIVAVGAALLLVVLRIFVPLLSAMRPTI